LVVGSLNTDLVLTCEGEPPDEGAVVVRDSAILPGGHAGNCASALAALGLSVTLLGVVGTDSEGDLVLGDLRRRGVDVSRIVRHAQTPTGRVVIPVFGEKHYMMLLRGANELLTPADLRVALTEEPGPYDAVMLSDPSLGVLLEAGQMVDRLPARPVLCWTPGGVYSRHPAVAQVVPHCDVVFANTAEHRALMRTAPMAVEEPKFELVLTAGREGSSMRQGSTRWIAPVHPVTVVDPTGAGDAFAAAYLLARLAGLEPESRLRAANRSGALAVGAVGAHASLATLADLLGPTEAVPPGVPYKESGRQGEGQKR
jgi:ribokinase